MRSSVYRYVAYGLTIQSALPLPELQPGSAASPDVVVRFGTAKGAGPNGTLREHGWLLRPEEASFYWDQVGAFEVRGGSEIVVEPRPGVEDRLVRIPLLGTVLAVLLHQRGLLVLHASAIAVDGAAVVFLGNKGSGKSTLAASLYARGHRLLADDVVAVDFTGSGRPLVLPGYPMFKLWPDAAAVSLHEDPERLPRLASVYEKRACRVAERFVDTALPLRWVAALGRGPVAGLHRLDPQQALVHLIAHTYVTRFGRQALVGDAAGSHLRRCAWVLERVPFYSLRRPASLPLLPQVAHLVEQRCRTESPDSLDVSA